MLICEGSNLILKNIIAQPRPHVRESLYTEFGMPSSHSQMSWFFATYCILFVIFRLRHNHGSFIEVLWKSLVILGLMVAACLISYSRVYLLYHTWSQIFWGSMAGLVLGGVWFAGTHLLFTPFFPTIASWKVCEFLMIRDTSLIPNVLWFEYTHARVENRSRSRKLVSMKSQ
ncbi:UNVERIFIED_CONTAM: hypothetical protein GTU68_025246 [Idotea baltica]|nr:hypothetical protein [Idotea baltica]